MITSPTGLHLIKHDLVTGVSTCGKRTKVGGHTIKVYGSRYTSGWEEALSEMLEKLCDSGGCTLVHEQHFSELDWTDFLGAEASPGQPALAGLPMSTMSREKRGNRIQEIGLAIDRRLHPCSDFTFLKGYSGKSNAPADWVRGCVRVELKSCSLCFDRSNSIWRCRFPCIKPNLFDELWLAIYSSIGIHYYRSNSGNSLSFVKDGVRTKLQGHTLVFYGPQGELDAMGAFEFIKAKIASAGCEMVAVVEWEKGRPIGKAVQARRLQHRSQATSQPPGS